MDAFFRIAIMKDYAMVYKVNTLLASESFPDQNKNEGPVHKIITLYVHFFDCLNSFTSSN